MKEVTFDNGAVLKVAVAPFDDAKKLFQSFLKILNGVEVERSDNFIFQVLTMALASSDFDRCLLVVMERSQYAENADAPAVKITPKIFETDEARANYVRVCVEVAMENLMPFTNGLSAGLKQVLAKLGSIQQSK